MINNNFDINLEEEYGKLLTVSEYGQGLKGVICPSQDFLIETVERYRKDLRIRNIPFLEKNLFGLVLVMQEYQNFKNIIN